MTSRKNLQRTITGLSVIPIFFGALVLLTGSAAIPDAGSPSASVESELRFYGAWYLGAGLFLASLAPRIEERGRELRIFAGLLILSAIGRTIGIAADGWPHPRLVGLMAVEYLLPPILVVWQARVARAERTGSGLPDRGH